MHMYVGHVKRDPEMDTGIAAAVCEAADPPITVRPGKAHITNRRCADSPRYRNRPHQHRSCSPDVRGGRGVVEFRLPDFNMNRSRKPAHSRAGGAFTHSTAESSADASHRGQHHPRSGATRGHGDAAGPASRRGSQARRSPDTHRRAPQTSNSTTLTRGKSGHTSLIPSSFRVKRRGSAQREQHDRIQAS